MIKSELVQKIATTNQHLHHRDIGRIVIRSCGSQTAGGAGVALHSGELLSGARIPPS
jgi:hypothetical protein